MEKTSFKRDRIDVLARGLERRIRELETEQFDREGEFRKLYADSAELLDLSRRGPAYLHERARRLNDLLARLHEQAGYRPDRFQLLFRQIDKIKDPLLSDLFSPSLQRRIDRLVEDPGGARRAEGPLRTPLLYRLGDFWFLMRSPVRQILWELDATAAERLRPRRGGIDFFPNARDLGRFVRSDDPLHLMVTAAGKDFRGLWFQESRAIDAREAERIAHNRQPTGRFHFMIGGKARYGGRTVYVVEPSAELP